MSYRCECGSSDLLYDSERGQLVCRGCGLVIEEKGQLPYDSELSAEIDRLGRRAALRQREEPRRPIALSLEGRRVKELIERAKRLDRAAREAPEGYIVANAEEVMNGGRPRYVRPVEVPRELDFIVDVWKSLDVQLAGMRPDKLRAAAASVLGLNALASRLHADVKRARRDVASRVYGRTLTRRLR